MPNQLKSMLFPAALLACLVAQPAFADTLLLTYTFGGTFDDGGTFQGTFGYDPIANAYTSTVPFGQAGGFANGSFSIVTTPGTQNFGQIFELFGPPPLGFSDAASDPMDFAVSGGNLTNFSSLMFSWANALNGPDGSSRQSITGGIEISIIMCSHFCTTRQRNVVDGFVMGPILAPVPLPAAGWLLACALGGFGAIRRRRLGGASDTIISR